MSAMPAQDTIIELVLYIQAVARIQVRLAREMMEEKIADEM